jgi:predicted amidohydrolase
VKVAVAQFASKPDATANRARALGLMRNAAEAGAELVVLPEAAMYSLDRPAAEIVRAAEALDGPFVTALAEAASALGVTAIAGMFEKVPGEQRVHNTVVAVGAPGVLGRYRKLHLYDALGHKESDSLVPGQFDGNELLVLPLGEFMVGVVTCYVSAAWVAGPLKQEHWTTMCHARAIENTCYLLAAAQPPPAYCGHSLVLDPMGVELAGLGETDGVAVAEISPERVRSVRAALPVLLQRRYEVRPKP